MSWGQEQGQCANCVGESSVPAAKGRRGGSLRGGSNKVGPAVAGLLRGPAQLLPPLGGTFFCRGHRGDRELYL